MKTPLQKKNLLVILMGICQLGREALLKNKNKLFEITVSCCSFINNWKYFFNKILNI